VAPEGDATRPTSDRAREAVFNALGSRGEVVGARVLDLFAGSGAMGIEALSRDAEHVVFVDADRRAAGAIEENLAVCGFVGQAEVLARPVERVLPELSAAGRWFDLAFCDPPYAFTGWDGLLRGIPAPLVVVEAGGPVEPPDGWELRREARYGAAWVGFVARQAPGEGMPG
jgi:16S rRNA (guanine966-N2)-methyltransferase